MADTGTNPGQSGTDMRGAYPAPSFAPDIEARRLELGARLLDLFPALYLTLASIIQGVAFSYLLGAVHDHLDHLTLLVALRAIASLELIAAVWSLYAIWAFALVWYPNVLDALIPFAYGAAEVLLCLAIGENMARWLGFAVSVNFMAFLSLVYLYRRAPLHARNIGVLAPVMQRFRANFGPLIAGFVMLVLWILTETGRLSGTSPIGPAIALAFFTGFLLNLGAHWRRFFRYLQGGDVSPPEP